MTNQKPAEPLPSRELVQQWQDEWWDQRERPGSSISELPFIATKAAQWGYNQRSAVNEAELQDARDEELEACCALADERLHDGTSLRAARRPKPMSLKKQALEALDEEHADMRIQNYKLIRAALERLRELEDGNA